MKTPRQEVKFDKKQTYAQGLIDGRVFEVAKVGTYIVDSPEVAVSTLLADRPWMAGQIVEVFKHLPGSKIGATFVESLGQYTVSGPTCSTCGLDVSDSVHRGFGPCT